MDTNGVEESVIVSEVSSFQGLKCMQEWYLGPEKVSCLERCPQFSPYSSTVCIHKYWCITVHVVCDVCIMNNTISLSLSLSQCSTMVRRTLFKYSGKDQISTPNMRGITLCGPKPSLEFEILLEVGKICSDHPVNF